MSDSTQPTKNRWLIAIMGTALQLCLGTVYAWSVFQKPLMKTYGWSNTQAMWIFSLAICFLGLAAAWGGINLPKFGPRKLAMAGGFLFGLGYFIASAALYYHNLPLLYLGYGVIGGIGLGLGYVTPVATAAKWFPDKKGFVTGMVVMGFGLGALLMSKLFAPYLLNTFQDDLVKVFAALGGIFMVCAMFVGLFIVNPPAGYSPPGWQPPTQSAQAQQVENLTYGTCEFACSGKFIMMWLIFFCNIAAGIAIIGFQSPLLQTLYNKMDPTIPAAILAAYGGTLVGITSLFNGIGRFFWGGVSDKIGRVQTFRVMLVTQIAVFAGLAFVQHPIAFSIMLCYVLLCYGGGFGTMPSFVLDVFGAKMMPRVYGFILTAWSVAGIVGPQITAVITDRLKDDPDPLKASQYSFFAGMTLLIIGLIISLVVSNSKFIPCSLREKKA